jgi:hypothetical protein
VARHKNLERYCKEVKKLAIVGSGENTRDSAPWDDPTFEIWVFNEAGNQKWCKRYDAVFQMHKPEIYTGHNTKDPGHWEWLQQEHGKPIYMQETDSRVPDSVRFPLEDATALVGLSYFSATFAYMAALAKLQGYEQIDVYGMDLSASEYQYQAECWRFWIGYLKGAGIQVNLHSGLQLFDAPLYGYEGNFAFGEDYFAERITLLENQWNAAQKNIKNMKKAIERAADNKEYEKVQSLTISFRDSAISTGELAGALAEAERYQTFGSRYADRGGFEFAAATAQRDGEAKRPMIWHYGGMVEYLWNIWKQTDAQQAKQQMFDFIGKMSGVAEEVGAQIGMYKENISYIVKYDAMVQANGGFRKELVTA